MQWYFFFQKKTFTVNPPVCKWRNCLNYAVSSTLVLRSEPGCSSRPGVSPACCNASWVRHISHTGRENSAPSPLRSVRCVVLADLWKSMDCNAMIKCVWAVWFCRSLLSLINSKTMSPFRLFLVSLWRIRLEFSWPLRLSAVLRKQ